MTKRIFVIKKLPKQIRLIKRSPASPLEEPGEEPSDVDPFQSLQSYLSNRYDIKIIRKLGEGGIGVVFEGEEETCGQRVVVKTLNYQSLKNDPQELKERIDLLQTEILQTPQTDNTIPVWQKIGLTPEKVVFAVRPYVEGETLAELNDRHLKRAMLLPVDFSAFIIHMAAKTLAVSHSEAKAHKDLCLKNLLINRQTGNPVLVDWGWPGVIEGQLFGGKPEYIAPELVERPEEIQQTDFLNADIFTLGTILYELVSGVNPFMPPLGSKKYSFDYRLEQAFDPERIPPLESICKDATRQISEITQACMRKNPQSRPSAGNLYACLLDYLYSKVEGIGVTTPAVSNYLKYFLDNLEPPKPYSLASLAFGRLRRPAEDRQFSFVERVKKSLKEHAEDIVREENFDTKFSGNALRSFVNGFGAEKVKSVILSLCPNLEPEYRNALPSYDEQELMRFLSTRDSGTNKEIHREIAKQALGRNA